MIMVVYRNRRGAEYGLTEAGLEFQAHNSRVALAI